VVLKLYTLLVRQVVEFRRALIEQLHFLQGQMLRRFRMSLPSNSKRK
jgi:hypothetical protein